MTRKYKGKESKLIIYGRAYGLKKDGVILGILERREGLHFCIHEHESKDLPGRPTEKT